MRDNIEKINVSVSENFIFYIIFRLDAVNESSEQLTEENIAGIKNFLNQQKTISELNELQNFIKNGLSISL